MDENKASELNASTKILNHKLIRETIDEILKSLWTRVYCSEVMKCEDEEGSMSWRATISHVAPDSYNLRCNVVDRLKENDITGVEIHTEW